MPRGVIPPYDPTKAALALGAGAAQGAAQGEQVKEDTERFNVQLGEQARQFGVETEQRESQFGRSLEEQKRQFSQDLGLRINALDQEARESRLNRDQLARLEGLRQQFEAGQQEIRLTEEGRVATARMRSDELQTRQQVAAQNYATKKQAEARAQEEDRLERVQLQSQAHLSELADTVWDAFGGRAPEAPEEWEKANQMVETALLGIGATGGGVDVPQATPEERTRARQLAAPWLRNRDAMQKALATRTYNEVYRRQRAESRGRAEGTAKGEEPARGYEYDDIADVTKLDAYGTHPMQTTFLNVVAADPRTSLGKDQLDQVVAEAAQAQVGYTMETLRETFYKDIDDVLTSGNFDTFTSFSRDSLRMYYQEQLATLLGLKGMQEEAAAQTSEPTKQD